MKPTFMDFLRGGEQINLMLAVDLTGSNRTPTNPISLHYLNPSGLLNGYQEAITSVGSVLLNYDYDGQVDCYGFGAFPNYPNWKEKVTNHCFPLSGNLQQC